MLKRTILTLAMLLTIAFAAHRVVAADPAHEPANAADAHATGEHSTPPLLPTNLHEAKEHFLTPALWTLAIFLILLMLLYPLAWKPILAGLKAREKRIRDDIADAERARARSEATLKEYNAKLASAEGQMRDMLAKAQADGERLATTIKMQAQQEAEEAKERATKEIESAKNSALREIHEHTATLATSVAEKILKRNLNADDQRSLVNESLAQLQSIERN